MEHVSAKRTLVKSPPELWSELSEVDRLARHLEAFGEITITKLEPEHTVAWEGEQTSGTVSIEPSGWGTKVTLTAKVPSEVPAAAPPAPAAESEPAAEPEHAAAPDPEPAEPEPAPPAAPPRKPGFFARLFGLPATAEPGVEQPSPEEQTAEEPAREPHPEPQREPEPEPAPEPEPEPEPATAQAQAVLEDALEALGSAHHRPFSRG